jgi:ABC-type uncharacterized transport system permease subunit
MSTKASSQPLTQRFAPLITSLAAIVAALVLGAIFLLLRGKDPVAAYAMLF